MRRTPSDRAAASRYQLASIGTGRREIPQNARYADLEKRYVTTVLSTEKTTKLQFLSGLTRSERKKLASRTRSSARRQRA